MKNLILSACASVLFLGLTSCSNDESLDNVNLEAQAKSLKSYKVKKDINGRYSIDYTLNSNTTSETVKGNGSSDIYLYAGEVAGKEKHNENLSLENNQLSVNFVENSKTKTSFIVEDENILLAKGENNNKFLQEHSFYVEDNIVQLDFKVRKGINVTFVYNELNDIYEVHLKQGKSNGVSFSKNFVKNDGNPLKIDFVNHLNTSSRGEELASRPRRPRVVVGGGGDAEEVS